VLAISLDGRLAPAEGGAAQLGGEGDRRMLEEALTWADAVLVGAQTLRLHGSTCLIHAPDLLRQRSDMGMPPQPIAVVWSLSGQLSTQLPFFEQPVERWLLLSASAANLPTTGTGFHTCLPFVDWPASLARLGALGVRRVAVLGGARLAGSLVAAKALDELQLTLCPVLLGGSHGWLPPDIGVDASIRWTLKKQESLQGGEQLLLYGRDESAG
jgi:5-amino-6-(5-phosphoribosylamino)uracil reductase